MVKEEKEVVEGSPKIFVTGLATDCSKNSLKTFFAKHGKVADVIYKFGADGNRIKDVAYVLFESEETVNKWLEEKTVTIDEKEVVIKKSSAGDGQKDEEPLLAVPKEALKCYVCKREKFPSVEAYLNHKKGKQHQAVYKIFKAKSSSVFQLLKAEAKLASDRAFDSFWMKKHPGFSHTCPTCQCSVTCKPEKHALSVEHKMVKNYNNQKCCDIVFTDRHKYEVHLLTLQHLKTAYEKEQLKKKDVDDGRPNMKKAIDIYKQCDADLKELKETYGQLNLNEELPPYDPNNPNPIGLNYIVKKINYHCICCDQKFFAHLNLVEPHCRSYNHYTNMTDYIVGVDKKIAQKRSNEEGEDKPNKKFDTSDNVVVKKKVKKEEDSTLNKSATAKDSDVKRKGKKDDDDEEEEDEDEDEEMDTKSNDDEEDVDQSESKDLDEEQEEGGDDEEQEEGDEDQDEGEEVGEEEAAEDQEEAAEDSDAQEAKEEEEDEQMQSDVEESSVTSPTAQKNNTESPAEDSPEEKEEEVAEESPKPTRGTPRGRRARGRGRGRGLKR